MNNNAKTSNSQIQVTIDDLYSLLFKLNLEENTSPEVQKRIEHIQNVIEKNINRKDVPAYSLQQTIELTDDKDQCILERYKDYFTKLSSIRQNLSQVIYGLP